MGVARPLTEEAEADSIITTLAAIRHMSLKDTNDLYLEDLLI